MQKREEEQDEHEDQGKSRERMDEREDEKERKTVCVLVSPLPLVFTWLLIHYTEHSTWLTGKERESEVGETQAISYMPFYGISVNGQGNERCGEIIVIDGH